MVGGDSQVGWVETHMGHAGKIAGGMIEPLGDEGGLNARGCGQAIAPHVGAANFLKEDFFGC